MALIAKSIKGTQDMLPADSYKWQYVEKTCLETARLHGYSEIRTPVFEHTELLDERIIVHNCRSLDKAFLWLLDKHYGFDSAVQVLVVI